MSRQDNPGRDDTALRDEHPMGGPTAACLTDLLR
jgi:hypothetical protein